EAGGPSALIVAGTASIVGEDFQHPGDLDRQIRETFNNLDSLVEAWSRGRPQRGSHAVAKGLGKVRADYKSSDDRGAIGAAILNRYPGVAVIEMLRADICRSELLVEIECTVNTSALCNVPRQPNGA